MFYVQDMNKNDNMYSNILLVSTSCIKEVLFPYIAFCRCNLYFAKAWNVYAIYDHISTFQQQMKAREVGSSCIIKNIISKETFFVYITKTCPYDIGNFFRSKIDNFQRKVYDIFLIFAQYIDCGYTLELPQLEPPC